MKGKAIEGEWITYFEYKKKDETNDVKTEDKWKDQDK